MDIEKGVATLYGSGAMARNVIAPMLRRRGYELKFYDADRRKAEEAGNEFDAAVAVSPEQALGNARVVAICTPMASRTEVSQEVALLARSGSLIFDIFSLKSIPKPEDSRQYTTTLDEMVRLTKDVSVFSVHPMHGPKVSPAGQRYPYMVGRSTPESQKEFLRIFSQERPYLFKTTTEEHDKAMAVVQVATWLSKITGADAVREISGTLGMPLDRLSQFSSFLYAADMDLTSRILQGNHDMYAEGITLNPYAQTIVSSLMSSTAGLLDAVKASDREGIKRILGRAKGDLATHIGSLKIPTEKPGDTQILFFEEHEPLLRQALGQEISPATYAKITEKRLVREARVKTGRFKALSERFPLAHANFLRNKDRVQGQFGFMITNKPFPQKLGDGMKEIFFDPFVLGEPDGYKRELSHRVQLQHRYVDPYVNLLSTYRRNRLEEKLGPLVVIGDPRLEAFRRLVSTSL